MGMGLWDLWGRYKESQAWGKWGSGEAGVPALRGGGGGGAAGGVGVVCCRRVYDIYHQD